MAAIGSTDVTVTISDRDKDIGHGPLSKNITIAGVAFGNGALTYPTGGVPLPTIGNFGYQRQIDFGAIEGDPGNGFVYKYDRANHKILIYTMGVVTGSTGAGATENGALAEDSAAAETVVRLSNTAVDTTYDLGPLIELPSGIAPAATALRMLLLGE
jgi:hypothetical protein